MLTVGKEEIKKMFNCTFLFRKNTVFSLVLSIKLPRLEPLLFSALFSGESLSIYVFFSCLSDSVFQISSFKSIILRSTHGKDIEITSNILLEFIDGRTLLD